MAPIIPSVLAFIGKAATSWFERRGRITEARETATIESIRERQRNLGYMDDLLLWMHAGPMVGVFFEDTRDATLKGIESLSLLPDWYLICWFTIVAAVWGAPKLANLKIKRKQS